MARIAGKANNANNLDSTTQSVSVEATLVYMNDGVRVCAEACGCCWDIPIPEGYQDQVKYLGKRAKTGHTSVLEHSNLVILLKLPYEMNSAHAHALVDLCSSVKYLNVRYASYADNLYVLIGGSYRAYNALIRLSSNQISPIMNPIKQVLYQNVPSEVFADLIIDNLMDEDRFTNIEPDNASDKFQMKPEDPYYDDDKISIVSYDNIQQISYNLNSIIGARIFSDADIGACSTITILFKDMSRTCTHQLVRHRNGITQESQRYVDYSESAFADPVSFKPEKYDPDTKYTIHFGGQEFSMTSMEIGENIIGIYGDVREQGMLKEDARSFLPGNVKCRKIYMTFTYNNYLKFLELRCHTAAQAEIRSYAIDCRNATEPLFMNDMEKNLVRSSVDEIIADKEVIMDNIVKATPELNSQE